MRSTERSMEREDGWDYQEKSDRPIPRPYGNWVERKSLALSKFFNPS